MGDTLRSLGFAVVEARDASRAQMQEAIIKVREQLRGKQGIGMLYYAGHGVTPHQVLTKRIAWI